LFYLRARGIPEDQARRLVVRGFFGEIISKIAIPDVRDRLTDAIERELAVAESALAEPKTGTESKADS
jgi:Fe-S cluster assembly protein SufD